jgi:hypothetical protein
MKNEVESPNLGPFNPPEVDAQPESQGIANGPQANH